MKYKMLFVVIFLLISGCSGNTFKMQEVDYIHPENPTDEEVLIYVFRENSNFGGARKFSIINNNIVMGVLNPANYTYYKVLSGDNEVVAYMSPSPISHYRVVGGGGKIVYLICKMGYVSGIYMEEISKGKAAELMDKFKYTEINVKGKKTKVNYREYYDRLYN